MSSTGQSDKKAIFDRQISTREVRAQGFRRQWKLIESPHIDGRGQLTMEFGLPKRAVRWDSRRCTLPVIAPVHLWGCTQDVSPVEQIEHCARSEPGECCGPITTSCSDKLPRAGLLCTSELRFSSQNLAPIRVFMANNILVSPH
jgi:hypothetical protein